MQNHCKKTKTPNVLSGQMQTSFNGRLLSADLSCSSKHKSLTYAGMLQLNKRNTSIFFWTAACVLSWKSGL